MMFDQHILRLALALTCLIVASCDSGEEADDTIDCALGDLPDSVQCMNINGVDQPFRFDEAALHGVWNSAELETCTVYRQNGSGSVVHWGSVEGLAPRPASDILWGIALNADGTDVVDGGQKFVFHQLTDGSLLDARMLLLNYDSSGLSLDFEQVDSCPDQSTGTQGALTFYTTTGLDVLVNVQIDGFTVGVLTESTEDAGAVCGKEDPGTFLTVNRQPGEYTVSASSAADQWGPLSVTVATGDCQIIPLR
jgi:hypothetical protein